MSRKELFRHRSMLTRLARYASKVVCAGDHHLIKTIRQILTEAEKENELRIRLAAGTDGRLP